MITGVAMTKLRTAVLMFALGVAVAALLAGNGVTVGVGLKEHTAPPQHIQTAPAQSATFVEVTWPFPRDQWGDGRAFRCAPGDCGVEVNLYVRPKIGFCNCDTGVADEAELDRVGDLELFSPKYFGLTPGDDIEVGWMRGLSRVYHVDIPYGRPRPVLVLAYNHSCDVMVATVTAPREYLPVAERHVLAFLNGEPMLKWTKTQFGI
jgi:hypothetical protein